MITFIQKLDILEDRMLVIKVPETVQPGPHEVVVILSEAIPLYSNAEALMRFARTLRSFAGERRTWSTRVIYGPSGKELPDRHKHGHLPHQRPPHHSVTH